MRWREVLEPETRGGIAHCDWLERGTKLGNLEVVRWADRGSWGFVYSLEAGGELWAGQLLWRGCEDRLADVERRVEELGRLRSGKLVLPRLVEVEVKGDRRWLLVSRWVDGVPAKDLVQRDGLDEKEVARIGRGGYEALADLHRAGVVHGEVSPSALVLSDAGEVMLGGLVGRALSAGRKREEAIRPLARYGAPELLLDGEDAGPASDVYSLGLSLVELLKGRVPWDSGSAAVDLVRRGLGRVEVSAESAGVAAVLTGSLERDAGRRPQAATAAELLSGDDDG